MVVNTNALEMLASLGLTEYEARAYAALLAAQPATAYELARAAAIPSSKIYETLSRLAAKGLAMPAGEGSGRGTKYAAMDPEDFLSAKKQDVAETAARLGPILKNLAPAGAVGHVWPISSTEAAMGRARRMTGSARKTILVSLWPQELAAMRDDLSAAVKRKVKVAVVHFGKPEKAVGVTFHHPVEGAIQREKGGRSLTLVTDGEEAAMATFLDAGGVEGAWSRNRAFVSATEDYIRHDIYITKVTALMGAQLRKKFGDDYERLRDVFLAAEEV